MEVPNMWKKLWAAINAQCNTPCKCTREHKTSNQTKQMATMGRRTNKTKRYENKNTPRTQPLQKQGRRKKPKHNTNTNTKRTYSKP